MNELNQNVKSGKFDIWLASLYCLFSLHLSFKDDEDAEDLVHGRKFVTGSQL
jgi:hypothetical protein